MNKQLLADLNSKTVSKAPQIASYQNYYKIEKRQRQPAPQEENTPLLANSSQQQGRNHQLKHMRSDSSGMFNQFMQFFRTKDDQRE